MTAPLSRPLRRNAAVLENRADRHQNAAECATTARRFLRPKTSVTDIPMRNEVRTSHQWIF
ncbi:MAG: hypothetical protein ACO3JL_19420 [Myxococcota bacterium]